MLVDVKFKTWETPEQKALVEQYGDPTPMRAQRGIYWGWMFVNLMTVQLSFKQDFPEIEPLSSNDWLGSYGVCDTVAQWFRVYERIVNDPVRRYAVCFSPVYRHEQSPRGGWRWHKWGQYIGDHKPEYEYLYDEDPSIECVLCYHICEIPPEAEAI